MSAIRVLVLDQAVGLWGAQRYLLRLAGPLAERDIELMLASSSHLDLTEQWRDASLPFMDLDLPAQRSVRDGESGRVSAGALRREAAQVPRLARRIAAAAVTSGSSLIHANGHLTHLEGAVAGRTAGLPSLLHLHEEMPQLFGQTMRALAVGTATESVAVSQAVADRLPRRLRRRATVIPNGIDAEAMSPGVADPAVRRSLGAAPDELLLVALTRLDPEKRIEDLLQAVLPLRDTPGWHLAIVGVTSSYHEYAEDVQREANELLGSRVTFTGWRSDVTEVLRASDLLVHAGVIEGMPLGLLEAQSCGIPVVAYSVAGVPEAVLDNETGMLVPPRDVIGLGRAINILLSDALLREKLGANGRRHVLASHSLSAQADRHAALVRNHVHRGVPMRQIA